MKGVREKEREKEREREREREREIAVVLGPTLPAPAIVRVAQTQPPIFSLSLSFTSEPRRNRMH